MTNISQQIRQEVNFSLETANEIKNIANRHPYWGLYDSRGWLSRYPNTEGNPLGMSREVVKALVNEGMEFDSMGHYGLSPYTEEYEGLSLDALREGIREYITLFDEGKWNYNFIVPALGADAPTRDEIELAHEFGLSIKPVTDRYNWLGRDVIHHALSKGVNPFLLTRREALDYLFKEGLIDTISPYPEGRGVKGVLITRKGWHRIDLYQRDVDYLNLDMKYIQKVKEERSLNWDFTNRYPLCVTHTTSIGEVIVSPLETRVMIKATREVVKAKKVGAFKALNLKGTYFMWKEGVSFFYHVEGRSLKECLNKLQAREALDYNSLSLFKIKFGANFCWAGTKAFLKDRLPHFYEAVKEFTSWDEVPETIMELRMAVNPEIFEGYPDPTMV